MADGICLSILIRCSKRNDKARPTQSRYIKKFPEEFASRANKPLPPPLPSVPTRQQAKSHQDTTTLPLLWPTTPAGKKRLRLAMIGCKPYIVIVLASLVNRFLHRLITIMSMSNHANPLVR